MEDLQRNMTSALKRVQKAGLTLNRKKCDFAKTEVKFLGHKLYSALYSPTQANWLRFKIFVSQTMCQVRSFL